MADLNSQLPPIENSPIAPPLQTTGVPQINTDSVGLGPSSKDVMIGAGLLLVAAVAYFFIRGAYVNFLVSSHKRSPNSAGMAGWALFGTLLFPTAIGALALIDKTKFLSLPFIIPLAGVGVVCLVLTIVSSMRK